jgi:hypothetical protein
MAKRGNLAKRTSVQVLDYVSSKSYTNLTLAQYIENTKEAGNYQLRKRLVCRLTLPCLMSTAKVPLSFLRIAILVKLKKPPCGGLFLIS